MADYAAIAKSAYAKIKAKGGAVGISRTTAGTYDPITGTETEATTTTDSTYALETSRQTDYFDQSALQVGDRVFLVPAYGINEPKPGDTFTKGGTGLNVVDVRTLTPADTPILYYVHARG